jgi:hypothetical protein
MDGITDLKYTNYDLRLVAKIRGAADIEEAQDGPPGTTLVVPV